MAVLLEGLFVCLLGGWWRWREGEMGGLIHILWGGQTVSPDDRRLAVG